MTNNPPPNDLPQTSVSLLDGVRQQSTGSWGRFTDFYGPLVYGKCRRAGLTEHDAQDVVQNVFVKVFKSIHTFRRSPPEMLFRKWFKVVTQCADGFRTTTTEDTRSSDRRKFADVLE